MIFFSLLKQTEPIPEAYDMGIRVEYHILSSAKSIIMADRLLTTMQTSHTRGMERTSFKK